MPKICALHPARWKPQSRPLSLIHIYAMCAFPLIGVVIGAAWCVCGALPLPGFAKAAGFALIPVWITGGIHLDLSLIHI